ncbi:MAG: carbohydrate kinase family protein [Candidatus Latescibacteria bacterium]|nr:carbohydrate kinase family protein [Candidatus Latescibacterota bacterium]
MKEKKYDVVVAGYLGVDLAPGFYEISGYPNSTDFFKPGSLTEVKDLSISLGGVVANTGLALKIFNLRVRLQGLVGNDILGEIALKILSENGLAEGIRTTDKSGTAYGIVLSPPGRDRIFFESPGCNRYFSSGDIDYNVVAESRIYHFGYPPLMKVFYDNNGKELAKMFSRIKKLDVLTSLDMTLPDPHSESGKIDWKNILRRVLPYVDIFTPSIEEIVFMMRPELCSQITKDNSDGYITDSISEKIILDIGREIISLGSCITLIKTGRNGAYLFTGDVSSLNNVSGFSLSEDRWNHQELRSPAFRVDSGRVKNASGAGDVAVAGFLAALLKNFDPEIALKYTMCAGRDNLYGINATDGLCDWETMTQELNR